MQTSENTRETAAAVRAQHEAECMRTANSRSAGQTELQAFAASMWAAAIDTMMRETR